MFRSKRKNKRRTSYRTREFTVPLTVLECVNRLHEKIKATKEAVPHTGQGWFAHLTFDAVRKDQNTYAFTIKDTPGNSSLTVSGVIHALDEHTTQISYSSVVDGCLIFGGIPLGVFMLLAAAFLIPADEMLLMPFYISMAVGFLLYGAHTLLLFRWELPQITALIHEALDVHYGGPEPTPAVVTMVVFFNVGCYMLPVLFVVSLVLALFGASPFATTVLSLLLVGGFHTYSQFSPRLIDRGIVRALARSDYDRALWLNRALKWAQPYLMLTTHAFDTSYANILLMAARYDEAEAILTRLLPKQRLFSKHDADKAWMICLLGHIASVKGDKARAKQYYERALAQTQNKVVAVKNDAIYRSLAGWYLELEQPERALEMLAQAYPRQHTIRRQLAYTYEIIQAAQAWAYALQGHDDAARSLLTEALEPKAETYLPGEASLHHIAARTLYVLGDVDAAREHLKTAIKLDPYGHHGHISRQRLAEWDKDAAVGTPQGDHRLS